MVSQVSVAIIAGGKTKVKHFFTFIPNLNGNPLQPVNNAVFGVNDGDFEKRKKYKSGAAGSRTRVRNGISFKRLHVYLPF